MRHPPRVLDKIERELLRGKVSGRRSTESGFKECANLGSRDSKTDREIPMCEWAGKDQPLENFHLKRSGKYDSYCIVCRRMINRDYKLRSGESASRGDERRTRVAQARLDRESGVRYCREPAHRKLTVRECGCGGHRDIKPKRWRTAGWMKKNRGVRGNRGNAGRVFSHEHRARIGSALREAHARRKAATR